MNREKIKRTISLLLLCLCILTGCGKQKVEYGSDKVEGTTAATEQTEKNGESGNDAELPGALAKSLGAKAKWEAEWALEQGEDGAKLIKVNADVVVPDTDAMQVVKMAAKEYTPEEKKKIAETLFDEGSIVMIGNGEYETKEKIKETIDYQNKLIIEEREAGASDDWVEETKVYIDYYQNLYDNFYEITENDYSERCYRGTVNGQNYLLYFGREHPVSVKNDEANTYEMEKLEEHKVWFLPDEARENITDKLGNYGLNPSEGDFGENQAKISVEDARKMALQYCEEMGISGMEVTSISDLNWGVRNTEESLAYEKTYCNGYIVVLRRYLNGVFTFEKQLSYMNYSYYGDDVTEGISPEILAFYLTDDGIIEMSYQSPMEVKEVLTEHTELLAFSKVQDVLKQHTLDYYNNYRPNNTIFLSTLQLSYMCVRDENDGKTCYLLPVWFLYEGTPVVNYDYFIRTGKRVSLYEGSEVVNDDKYGISDPLYSEVVEGIAINAVDGSMINVVEQQED